MKVNDIDYNEFQKLLNKSESLDKVLSDKDKYFKIDPYTGIYIKLTEADLIKEFKAITERKDLLEDTIARFAAANKMYYWEFMDRYKPKEKK